MKELKFDEVASAVSLLMVFVIIGYALGRSHGEREQKQQSLWAELARVKAALFELQHPAPKEARVS